MRKKLFRKERKTKFSEENHPVIRRDLTIENKIVTTIGNTKNDDDHEKTPEKKQISFTKRVGTPLNIKKKEYKKDEENTNININVQPEDKEEGELEDKGIKNFKIVQAEGKKTILLTGKRKVTELKVVKKDK